MTASDAGAASEIWIARGRVATAAADTVAVRADDAGLAALTMAAREALLAGDAATALALYDQLAVIVPQQRSAMLGRAIALGRLGRHGEAQAVYQELLESDPDDLAARTAYLGLLAEVAPGGALAQLRTLARRHGDQPQLMAQIGLAEARRGDAGRAIVAMRRAVAADPMNPSHHMNLAVLYDRIGQAGAAIDHYRKALAMAMRSGDATLPLDAIDARLRHLSRRSG
jgi:Flp pilus assembly protein TadD